MKKTKLITTIIAAVALAASAAAQNILPLTQLEQDVAAINRAAQGTTYYGQLLVAALNNAHAAVWSLPDARLEAVLNKLGPTNVAAFVNLHSATAAALNQSLDAVGDPGPRAIVLPSREYTVDAEGHITVTPLEEPEQEE